MQQAASQLFPLVMAQCACAGKRLTCCFAEENNLGCVSAEIPVNMSSSEVVGGSLHATTV